MRTLVVVSLAAASFASGASAQIRLAAFRADMTASEFAKLDQTQELRDQAECREQGEQAAKAGAVYMAPPVVGGIGGAAAAGLALGLANSFIQHRQAAGSAQSCMAERGYRPRDLEPAETAASRSLSAVDRKAWMAATPLYVRKNDTAAGGVMMWDVSTNAAVTVRRDPATGQLLRTWAIGH